MSTNLNLSILIPARNEENTIEMVIKKAQKWMKMNHIEGEILVVNNNSTDKTKEIAINNQARVIDVKEIGYGNTLREGIKEANGKYIIMGDADDSYNFLELDDFYKLLNNGYDLVIGNRYHYIEKGAMKWTHRYLGTPLLTKMINKKYKLNLKDINCGLRGMKKEKILELNLKSEGMEFASEMVIKAKQANLKIAETPIKFYKDKRNHKSHLNTVKDGFRHIEIILNFR